ncbi:thioesterase II family protein [Alkalinema pantanalense CENA528]|uniref:thioesterase II family protein n=1 Tax=Alkalinema pantanalense TaxID=1620705 RepID=UPI003D6FDA8B
MTTISTANPWLTCPKPKPQAHLRLFCLPYAGGSALNFRSWINDLPPTIELCPIELPGRGLRLPEPAFDRLEPLVQVLGEALLPALDRPFAIFGHSLGALLGFEWARWLRRRGARSPMHLLLSGRRAPQVPTAMPLRYNLPEPDFLAALNRLNGTPQAILEHPELMQLLLPTLRADFSVVETSLYHPEPPLACPVTVFGGVDDPETTLEGLQAWQTQTQQTFRLELLPGDHFFLHSAQPQLLTLIQQTLTQTLQTL